MRKTNSLFAAALLLLSIGMLLPKRVQATHFYFSTRDGDDSRSAALATNATTPWKTLEKLNNVSYLLHAGDSVFFRCDDVFYGSLLLTSSGTPAAPIVFSSYGQGARPRISGFTNISTWSSVGTHLLEASLSNAGDQVNMVILNGKQVAPGRFPNRNAANGGFLSIESASGNNFISDPQLPASPDWTGADVIIRKTRWVLDRNFVTSHNGNNLYYQSQSPYQASRGYGYFFQNHPAALDLPGEWYFNKNTKRLGLYSNDITLQLLLQASTVQTLVTINYQANLVFLNLDFSGANKHSFEINGGQNLKVDRCSISFSGVNAVQASNCSGLSFTNNEISHTNNIAFNCTNCPQTIISHNNITSTGSFPGLGEGDSGSYEAILVDGDQITIEGNVIDSTGYVPLGFRGNNIVVKNNVITNFAFVKDDGGGIYTWNNIPGAANNYGRVIESNIVLNGLGAGAGTPEPGKLYAHGIYIDDNAAGIDISNNTVANCAANGFYIHNAHELNISGNTVYNNGVQLLMSHDQLAPQSPVVNNNMNGNIFFSKTAAQPVAIFSTSGNDLNSFGAFDNNYYARPADDQVVINASYVVNNQYQFRELDLGGWQTLFGKDLHSGKSPREIRSYQVRSLTGTNKYANGNFNNNINGLYAYAAANNVALSWAGNSVLDGGSLIVSFTSTAGNDNKASVIIGAGATVAGKNYLLKFSLAGASENKLLAAYLRKSQAPYTDLSERKKLVIHAGRIDYEYLLTASGSEADASLVFDIGEGLPLYIDNVSLVEADISPANIDDSLRFLYNPTSLLQQAALNGTFIDVRRQEYSANTQVAPFGSLVLLKKNDSSIVMQPVCSATGSILREQWNGVSGNDIHSNIFLNPPSGSGPLTSFEGPVNTADNYASRIRGYICPPQTGAYTFWIAADDAAELWLSTDENATAKVKIASLLSWTNPREWYRYPSQQSAIVNLVAGRRYYIEALHQEGAGGDHLAVAWKLPNGVMEGPIPGNRLSPYVPGVNKQEQAISFGILADKPFGSAPFQLSASSSSGLPVSFAIVSGPATVNGNLLTLTGVGAITVAASQAGNQNFNPAPQVVQQFNSTQTIVCAATGSILREQWDNIGGNDIIGNIYASAADQGGQVTAFEGPENIADSYASRIRGYICPPQTGAYTFFIAGDDATELWLSNSANPAGKVKIAFSLSWTNRREWYKFTTQKSASITLVAGTRYYIEARHKEGGGGDHLSVAWQLPGGEMEAPIPGNRLSPFVPGENKQDQVISFGTLADKPFGSTPFLLTASSSSGLPVTYSIQAGPALLNGSLLSLTGIGAITVSAAQAGNQQFNPAPAVSQQFNSTAPVNCMATGSIVREQWNNVGGNDIMNSFYASPADQASQLNSFEGPVDVGDNYASRIRGYICPPQTGAYTFFIAGDDATELWLSNSDNPAGKVKIAYSVSWTSLREWNKFATQKSLAIPLVAGTRYYIEALQKEGNGGDHLSVGWQLPDGVVEAPVPGSRLSPFFIPIASAAAKRSK